MGNFRWISKYQNSILQHNLDVTKDLGQYDIILGLDFLQKMGLELNFNKGTMQLQNTKIDMKDTTRNKDNTSYIC